MTLKSIFALVMLVLLAACAPPALEPASVAPPDAIVEPTEEPSEEPENTYVFIAEDATTTDSGLQYVITEEGDGASPQPGDIVEVHYTARFTDGNIFDSSYDRENALRFKTGAGQVIPGWDEAIMLMRVGDKAKLIIPPELAYGKEGVGQDIPPDSTLYFEVELLDVLPEDNTPPTAVSAEDYTITESGLQVLRYHCGRWRFTPAGRNAPGTLCRLVGGWNQDR